MVEANTNLSFLSRYWERCTLSFGSRYYDRCQNLKNLNHFFKKNANSECEISVHTATVGGGGGGGGQGADTINIGEINQLDYLRAQYPSAVVQPPISSGCEKRSHSR